MVTDLDGTLLDHHTYSYLPALPALHKLGSKAVPLILCSSKTRAEIVHLREELGTSAPYIVENGAAICEVMSDEGALCGETKDIILGLPYREILENLRQLRETLNLRFRGFNDMSVDEIVDYTGLAPTQAALAKRREFSEPLIWQDSEEHLQTFLKALADRHLVAQQGGRFLTIAGKTDKGKAVDVLRQIYIDKTDDHDSRIVALGDSPNDESMLNAADIAVVIKSEKSAKLKITGPEKVIYTKERGPQGWNSAILEILED